MENRIRKTICTCIILCAVLMSGFAYGRYIRYPEDNGDKESTEANEESDIITFCVLGKETLEIDEDRFEYGRLDNLWELDEINKIFDSLQGEWEIDQYFDFVYWRIYEPDLFDLHDNIGEERRQSLFEAYYEKVKAAEENIPELSFSIRKKLGEERKENYVYQQGYESPVSIIMSKDRNSEFYPGFRASCAIPKDEHMEYPVLYIKFMRYRFDKKISEPATLVIAADGGFYVLIDGAYYSLKQKEETDEETDEEILFGNEFESMMQGDFSAVFGLSDEEREELQNMYLRGQERDDVEWVYFDINADGAEELVYQQKEPVSGSNKKRIIAVFAMTAKGCKRIIWDTNDMGEYYFLADDKIVYYYRCSGGYQYEAYTLCSFDKMWHESTEKILQILLIDDMESYKVVRPNLWNIPQPAEHEYYYHIVNNEGDMSEQKPVQAEEWFQVFEEEVGEIEKYGPESKMYESKISDDDFRFSICMYTD